MSAESRSRAFGLNFRLLTQAKAIATSDSEKQRRIHATVMQTSGAIYTLNFVGAFS